MATVFFSYSHDSPEHREDVLGLAKQLLAAGHSVTLDRFTAHPDPNWPQWMARELIAADVVLCICTPTYRQRFEGTAAGGFGVAWEGHMITTELYRLKGKAGRFIPVEVEEDAVPLTLRGLPAVPFDAVVAQLGGVVGPPVDEPLVHPGWTEAMSVGALVGPIWKPLRPPRAGEGYAPTQLLRAEHAVVPFLGRAQQLDDLEAWCRGGGVRVRVVHGPGGAGKTRLSLEAAANRCREGWRAGPLAVWRDAHAPLGYLDALFRDKIPLFLIVDYAETRAEVLVPLLQRLAKVEDASARVLLVARAKGDWWDRAMAEVPELDRMRFGWADVRVDEVEAGVEHAKAAAASFAAWLGRAVPREVRDYGRTALDRQVEALVAVLGGGPLEGMPQLLRHEDRFLLNAGALAGVPDAVGRLLPKLMALVTLAGGLGAEDVRAWMPTVDGLDDLRKAEVRAVVELLGDLYPRDDGGVDGMRPDRVGEALVAREDLDGKLAEVAVDRGRAKAALTVLTRLGTTGLEAPLWRLCRTPWRVGVPSFCQVAEEVGHPLPQVIAEQLRGDPDLEFAKLLIESDSHAMVEPRLVAARLIESSPSSESDREAALHIIARTGTPVERVYASGEVLRGLQRSPTPRTMPNSDVRGAQITLGHALLANGEQTTAGRYFHQAAASLPAVNRSTSADSFNEIGGVSLAYATYLTTMGRHLEALRWADRGLSALRAVASDAPELVADALTTRGMVQQKLGRSAEAVSSFQESLAILRSLGADKPLRTTGSMERVLDHLTQALTGVGDTQKAVAVATEAVALRERARRWDPVGAVEQYVEASKRLSVTLQRSGDFDTAIRTAERCVSTIRALQDDGVQVPLDDRVTARALVVYLNMGAERNGAALRLGGALLRELSHSGGPVTPRTRKLIEGLRSDLAELATSTCSMPSPVPNDVCVPAGAVDLAWMPTASDCASPDAATPIRGEETCEPP